MDCLSSANSSNKDNGMGLAGAFTVSLVPYILSFMIDYLFMDNPDPSFNSKEQVEEISIILDYSNKSNSNVHSYLSIPSMTRCICSSLLEFWTELKVHSQLEFLFPSSPSSLFLINKEDLSNEQNKIDLIEQHSEIERTNNVASINKTNDSPVYDQIDEGASNLVDDVDN